MHEKYKETYLAEVDIMAIFDLYEENLKSYHAIKSAKSFLKFLAIELGLAFKQERSAVKELSKLESQIEDDFCKSTNVPAAKYSEAEIETILTRIENAKTIVTSAKTKFWMFHSKFSEKIKVFPSYKHYLMVKV